MGVQADRGTVFLEMRYHPFKAAGKAAAANEPGAQKANMTLGMSKKMLTHDHKGVLTITLIRCVDLEVLLCPLDARLNINIVCSYECGVLRTFRPCNLPAEVLTMAANVVTRLHCFAGLDCQALCLYCAVSAGVCSTVHLTAAGWYAASKLCGLVMLPLSSICSVQYTNAGQCRG